MRAPLLQRLLTGILAAILLLTAIGAAAYGLIVLVDAGKEILVAVIAAAASLLSAVFAYVFQRNKELELAAVQKDRELELAAVHQEKELAVIQRKTMQDNYARVLDRLAPYIRNPSHNGDDFTTAHLFTWVVGSPEVVALTSRFMRERTPDSLDALLLAMRKDLALETRPLREVSTQELFPIPAPVGGFLMHGAAAQQAFPAGSSTSAPAAPLRQSGN